jgi:hypothetical protein
MDVDEDFIEILKSCPMEQLDNLGITNINIFEFRKKYLYGKTVQSVSKEPNANVQRKSPANLRSEQIKPWNKIEGLLAIWNTAKDKFGKIIQIKPEYEDVKRIAEKTNKPLRELIDLYKSKAKEELNGKN